MTTATRSFGPVPASDLITMVMPKARITQPVAHNQLKPQKWKNIKNRLQNYGKEINDGAAANHTEKCSDFYVTAIRKK